MNYLKNVFLLITQIKLKTTQLKWNNKSKTHTKHLRTNNQQSGYEKCAVHLLHIYSVTVTCTSTRSQQPLRLLSLIRLVEFENKYARQFGWWSNTNKHSSGVKNNIIHSQPCKSTKLTCCNELVFAVLFLFVSLSVRVGVNVIFLCVQIDL